MATTFLIGRSNTSCLPVPGDKTSVSGRHAMIAVSDGGKWILEDLDSTNGTYVMDENGEFQQVFKKTVSETDFIRLGSGGVHSYIFMAHRVLDPKADYTYEFKQLRRKLKRQREEEGKREKRLSLQGWITASTALIIYGLFYLMEAIWKVSMDPVVRFATVSSAPLLVKLIFDGDNRAIKHLRKRRDKTLICPNPGCSKPLAEYDIEQGACSKCGAS